jgi:hypothetical protein
MSARRSILWAGAIWTRLCAADRFEALGSTVRIIDHCLDNQTLADAHFAHQRR